MPTKRHKKPHRRQRAAIRLAAGSATPTGHTATGFPVPGANGVLTPVGDINGQPLYQSAGGWYFAWMGTPTGWWAVQPDDPRVTGFNGVYYRQDATLAGPYVIGGTSTLAGMVS